MVSGTLSLPRNTGLKSRLSITVVSCQVVVVLKDLASAILLVSMSWTILSFGGGAPGSSKAGTADLRAGYPRPAFAVFFRDSLLVITLSASQAASGLPVVLDMPKPDPAAHVTLPAGSGFG